MVDYLALSISIGALIIALSSFVINYHRSRKIEQIKLCIEISNNLDYLKNKILEIDVKLKSSNTTDHQIISGWKSNLQDAFLSYLDHWEFFAFLVNIKEIQEEKILDYYKDNFKTGVELAFEENHIVRDDIQRYKEIKKLLKKWDPNYYS